MNKRLTYMDIFRGMGISLMIMGHIGFGKHFDHFIHAFHMPMFFFISGFFYDNKKNFSVYVKNKAKRLLIPYISFGIGHYVLWLIVNWNECSLTPLLHLLYENTDDLPIAGALWFLTSLFLTELLYFTIDKISKNVFTQNILILGGVLLGHILVKVLPVRLPYASDAALVGLGLFHIGVLIREESVIKRCLSLLRWKWFVAAICITVLIFLNGYINMRTGNYAIIPLFWMNAIGAIIVGLNLAKYIEIYIKEVLVKGIMSIGRNSIVYVCLNQVVLLILKKLIEVLSLQIYIPNIIIKIIELGVALLILGICSSVINHTKLKVFIGKF